MRALRVTLWDDHPRDGGQRVGGTRWWFGVSRNVTWKNLNTCGRSVRFFRADSLFGFNRWQGYLACLPPGDAADFSLGISLLLSMFPTEKEK